jgi:hypothetical protein
MRFLADIRMPSFGAVIQQSMDRHVRDKTIVPDKAQTQRESVRIARIDWCLAQTCADVSHIYSAEPDLIVSLSGDSCFPH